MPSPNATPTPITPPRVPLIDPRTGLIDRAWYLFFLSLNQIATNVVEDVVGPSSESLLASYDAALRSVNQELQTLPPVVNLPAPDVLTDCCSALVSQVAEMQKQIEALNLLPPPSQGTVTAVTATSPVVSSGGTAPDISMPAASTLVSGYLTSTDWNTFNNKAPATSGTSILYGNGSGGFSNVTIGSGVAFAGGTLSATGSGGTVTSVTGTAPVVSSGGTTPAISMAAANTSTSGYLTSTDWNTFNNKQPVSAPVTYTANFSVAATDVWIINNKSGSSCTATLPAASSYSGRVLRFQNYQAQTLISASSNVVPLVGGAAGTAILAAVAGETCTLVSDGTNWIMTQYTPNNVLLLE